jgi:hypothetical protein
MLDDDIWHRRSTVTRRPNGGFEFFYGETQKRPRTQVASLDLFQARAEKKKFFGRSLQKVE